MPKSPTPERDGAREASRSIYTPSTKRESRETGQYRLTKKTFIILTTVTHNPDLTSALSVTIPTSVLLASSCTTGRMRHARSREDASERQWPRVVAPRPEPAVRQDALQPVETGHAGGGADRNSSANGCEAELLGLVIPCAQQYVRRRPFDDWRAP